MLMGIGIAYDTASEITPTDTKAKKAEDDPRLMSPSNISTTVVNPSAQMGTPCRLSTRLHSLEIVMALSRTKAHMQRDAPTVMEMEKKEK